MDAIDKVRKALHQHEDLQEEAFLAAKAILKRHGFPENDEHVPMYALNYLNIYQELVGFSTQAPPNAVETRFIATEDLLCELRARRKKAAEGA